MVYMYPHFISSVLLSLNHFLWCGFAVSKFSQLLFIGKLFILLSFLVIFLFCHKNLEKSGQNGTPVCLSPRFPVINLLLHMCCFILHLSLLFRGSNLPLNSSLRFFISVFVLFTSRDLFDSFSDLQSNFCSVNLPSKILIFWL